MRPLRNRSNPFVGRPGTEGVHAIVYHGSKAPPQAFAEHIKQGFQFRGAGGLYGFGLYTVFREDKESRTFKGTYGPYVYRMVVPLRNYIVFDHDAAREVYGENPPTVRAQMERMGLYAEGALRDQAASGESWEVMDKDPYSSVTAMSWFFGVLARLDAGQNVKLPNGIIFKGAQDGYVCAIFNPENMLVSGHKTKEEPDFTPSRFAGRDWRTKLEAPSPRRLVLGDFDLTEKKAFMAVVEFYAPKRRSDQVKRDRVAKWLRKDLKPLGVYRAARQTDETEAERNTFFAFAMNSQDASDRDMVSLLLVGRAFKEDSEGRTTWTGEPVVTSDASWKLLPITEDGGPRAGSRELFAKSRPNIGFETRSWDGTKMVVRDVDNEDVLYVPVVMPPAERRNPASAAFTLNDLTPDEVNLLADAFRASYLQATGSAWTTNTFMSRARNWRFYGEVAPGRTGVVAIRPQHKMNKLVAVAGAPRGVMNGIKALMEAKRNEPLWGAVSEDLVPLCARYGLIPVHTLPGGVLVIKAVAKLIPAEVFGGSDVKVMSDGALELNVIEIGPVKKYFVANKAYFTYLASAPEVPIPAATAWMLRRFVAALP